MSQAYQLHPERDLTVLIPARAGSKRCPGKNTRMLGGKPLIQWTIDAATAANVARIIVSSDSEDVFHLVNRDCDWRLRKPEHATDEAPDILWVLDVLPMVTTPYVAICRPTSPFRTASTIRRGFAAFMKSAADSIRAVERVTAHPAKMWYEHEGRLTAVLVGHHPDGTPWHSAPTQTLPVVYQQNASLEIARVAAIRRTNTITGSSIAPFFTEQLEGFDINTPDDWDRAEAIASTRR